MEEQNQSGVSGAASTSIEMPFSQDTEGDGADQAPVAEPESRVSHYLPLPPNENEPCAFIKDDTLFCITVVLTFWLFVSVTLILGFYGTSNLRLGPNCSILIKPNPIFVDYVKVEQVYHTGVTGQMLYGFYEVPPLDVVTDWSVSHSASLLANSRKDWMYFLNEGSQINISYSVKSSSSSALILAIAQGNDGFAKWITDPSYPNTTSSWNIIHGNGMIQQDIKKSSTYYIGVSNLNTEAVEVNLNLKIKDFHYNTTDAYFTCTLAQGECSLKTFFPKGNAAVLTTPGPKEGTSYDDWYIKLSYVPRWSTYLVGIGGMSLLMLVAFHFFTKFGRIRTTNRTRVQSGETGPTRVPLLSQKDNDDMSSWGSSYDSGSQDGEDPEDGPLIDGEFNINTRRLCVICFDAPRDCFFLPCGHCAACFACGTRIAEAAKSCPICRRRMKKVKKIFTV